MPAGATAKIQDGFRPWVVAADQVSNVIGFGLIVFIPVEKVIVLGITGLKYTHDKADLKDWDTNSI